MFCVGKKIKCKMGTERYGLQYSNSRLKPLQVSCCLDTWPDVVLSSSSLPNRGSRGWDF